MIMIIMIMIIIIIIIIVRSSTFYSKYILRLWYSVDFHGSRIGTVRRTDCTYFNGLLEDGSLKPKHVA